MIYYIWTNLRLYSNTVTNIFFKHGFPEKRSCFNQELEASPLFYPHHLELVVFGMRVANAKES